MYIVSRDRTNNVYVFEYDVHQTTLASGIQIDAIIILIQFLTAVRSIVGFFDICFRSQTRVFRTLVNCRSKKSEKLQCIYSFPLRAIQKINTRQVWVFFVCVSVAKLENAALSAADHYRLAAHNSGQLFRVPERVGVVVSRQHRPGGEWCEKY